MRTMKVSGMKNCLCRSWYFCVENQRRGENDVSIYVKKQWKRFFQVIRILAPDLQKSFSLLLLRVIERYLARVYSPCRIPNFRKNFLRARTSCARTTSIHLSDLQFCQFFDFSKISEYPHKRNLWIKN